MDHLITDQKETSNRKWTTFWEKILTVGLPSLKKKRKKERPGAIVESHPEASVADDFEYSVLPRVSRAMIS